METAAFLAVALTVAVVVLIVGAAWHIWYALGLARVLQSHGVEPWRAWVPLLNDAEILRMGRIDPVKAALLLVPLVAVYGVVLRAIAAHRVNIGVGRGAGATVLAVLLPPVWAMVIAGAEPIATGAAADDDDEADEAPLALSAGGVRAVPALAPAGPPAVAPIAPGAAWAPAAAPVAAPPAPLPEPPVIASPVIQAPVIASPVITAAPLTPPPAAPVVEPVTPDVADATSYRRRSREDPIDDETSIVRGPRSWELVLPSGEALAVTARTIVLGRKPLLRRGEAQYVTVDDDTRTVSKEHAQLQWSGEGWLITDLGSVNGIALLDPQGVAQQVAPGASVPVDGEFLLGDARLSVRRVDTA
ncbi:FHA domain-containing protein [Microbacterium sp. P05]|uniref:FHA domain-containing protein n=1 Tax=Microbacterium sp. P05 TaxID=3366948 RepID=UPI00374622EF